MKLYATITSDNGKEIGKGGNEFIAINIMNKKRVIFGTINVFPNGYTYGSIDGQKFEIGSSKKQS